MRIILIFILSIIIFTSVICLGAINDPVRVAGGVFIYFLSFSLIRNFWHKIFIYLPFGIFTFYCFYQKFVLNSNIRLYETLPLLVIVPLLLFIPFNVERKLQILIISAFSIFLYFFWFNYNTFIYSKRNKKEFPKEIGFLTLDDKLYDFQKNENKTIVLNFFSNGCALCFQEMPNYERFKVKNDFKNNVEVLSVYLPYKEELSEIDNKMLINTSSKYSFQVVKTNILAKEVSQKLDFNGVPYSLVIKDNKIVYAGRFNYEWYYIIDNINYIVK